MEGILIPLKCSLCQKFVLSKKSLTAHVKEAHGKFMVSPKKSKMTEFQDGNDAGDNFLNKKLELVVDSQIEKKVQRKKIAPVGSKTKKKRSSVCNDKTGSVEKLTLDNDKNSAEGDNGKNTSVKEDTAPEVNDAAPEVNDAAPEVNDAAPVESDAVPKQNDAAPEQNDAAKKSLSENKKKSKNAKKNVSSPKNNLLKETKTKTRKRKILPGDCYHENSSLKKKIRMSTSLVPEEKTDTLISACTPQPLSSASTTKSTETPPNTSISKIYEGGLTAFESDYDPDFFPIKNLGFALDDDKVSLALTALISPEKDKRFILSPTLTKSEIKIVGEHFNDVTISHAGNGKVEILYTGLKTETAEMGGEIKEEKNLEKYSEYRREMVDRFHRKRPRSSISKNIRCMGTPPDIEKTIYLSIPKTKTQVFNVHGQSDDLHSIMDVLAGQKITTRVLDAYLSQKIYDHNMKSAGANANSKLESRTRPTFEYLPVLFFPIFERDQDILKVKPDVSLLPDGNYQDSVLIAPIFSCHHFFLTVFDFPCKTIFIYDSSWKFFFADLRFHQIRCILKALIRGATKRSTKKVPDIEEWSVIFKFSSAQQTDDFNCSCYVVHFVENHVNGRFQRSDQKLTLNEITSIRQDMARQLLSTTNIGRDVLDAISY